MSVCSTDNFRFITDIIDHTLVFIHIHIFLCKYADFYSFAVDNRTTVWLEFPCHHIHQCRFAAAIIPDDTYTVISQDDIAEISDICFAIIGF